jgi:uncharacterized protein YndB with AHSA1/START domain
MSVKTDASGRRSVQVEVEVPGSPEEVWQAIATGPGISSWFVPTEFEERDGVPVSVVSHFGPGMDAVATVTAWDPPHRFAAEGEWGPGAPPIATEWIVESRSGGMCVVRVVHSLFASTDDWDDQLTGTESGWPGFFRILRLYLSHFRGQRSSVFQLMGMVPGPESEAWDALTGSLGLAGATIGERRSTPPGAPPLAGTVELAGEGRQLLLRLDEPAPGIAHLIAQNIGGGGGQVMLAMNFYLYGDGAPAVAARVEPLWRAWMTERFPSMSDASTVAC